MRNKSMPVSLRQLQEDFQAYVLDQSKDVLATISTDHTDAIERIDVYRKGYSLRLLEILEKDFPCLKKLMGEEAFNTIGYEYINAFPSDNFSVCKFSRHYSRFVLETKKQPFWSEVAGFEWATSCALDAADGPQIDPSALGAIAPESFPYVQFIFHPSVELYPFHYNAPQVSLAVMLEEESIPEPLHNEQAIDFIIWRFNMRPYFESLTKEQVWIVSAIRQGKTFAEICEGLCQWFAEEEVAQFAAGTLSNWLSKGLFSAITIAQIPEEVAALTNQ